MAKASAPRHPSSYELLAMRLQKAMNNPMAQKRKYAVLERLPDDQPDDRAQILGELDAADPVVVAHRDDGGVQVFWTVVKDDGGQQSFLLAPCGFFNLMHGELHGLFNSWAIGEQ